LIPARFQPADENVKGNSRPEVADMRRGLHGGTTHVQRHSPGNQGREFAYFASGSVMQAQGHAA